MACGGAAALALLCSCIQGGRRFNAPFGGPLLRATLRPEEREKV